MNSLIIIGNGFDLAHGLKTSYRHFIDWFWEEKKCKMKASDIVSPAGNNANGFDWFKPFWDSNSRYSGVKSDEIERLGHNSFLRRISDKISLKNWLDIENEYYKALIDKDLKSIIQLNNEFLFIQSQLEEYLALQIQNKVAPVDKIKRNLDSIFKNHSKEYVMSYMSANRPIMFLSFNYTNTEEIYLKKYYEEYSNIVRCIHIHGELNNPKNPVIFGYGDELDDNFHCIESLNDNDYLKMIKSIKYFQTNNYQKALSFIDSDNFEIFIMGHSCGNSDRTLLNTLFEHPNCKFITAFYYQNDEIDNFSDITMNIFRNFIDKKRMRSIVRAKPDCQPLS